MTFVQWHCIAVECVQEQAGISIRSKRIRDKLAVLPDPKDIR